MDKASIIQEYLDKLEYAIGRVDADVLAHFDYGFRLFDVTIDELKAYEEQLKRIFQKMIANDLAFELNAKSMYLYHHEALYRYALGLVKGLGCRKYMSCQTPSSLHLQAAESVSPSPTRLIMSA